MQTPSSEVDLDRAKALQYAEEYLAYRRREDSDILGIDTDAIGATELPVDLLFIRPVPWWKRAMDIVGASVAIFIFAIPMLFIAIAIRLTSPGPAIFRQVRGGHGGKPFVCYKFRTMVQDAEARKADLLHLNERKGPVFKMKADPRVTKVGAFLRSTSLDELPQFFNVLKGDMSLVGPRPLPIEEDRGYSLWHRYRQMVKPGITCIWQVVSRDESCFDEWVRQDIQYIRNFGFWQDVKLLLLTLPAVLLGRGAH